MIRTLTEKVKAIISGNGFMVYDVEPENPSYPYAFITNPNSSDEEGGKDKRYTTGTFDIIIKTTTSRMRGSTKKLYTLSAKIKDILKPSEDSILDLGLTYTNSVLYLSAEVKTEQKEKTKRILINKLTYFFEVETN